MENSQQIPSPYDKYPPRRYRCHVDLRRQTGVAGSYGKSTRSTEKRLSASPSLTRLSFGKQKTVVDFSYRTKHIIKDSVEWGREISTGKFTPRPAHLTLCGYPTSRRNSNLPRLPQDLPLFGSTADSRTFFEISNDRQYPARTSPLHPPGDRIHSEGNSLLDDSPPSLQHDHQLRAGLAVQYWIVFRSGPSLRRETSAERIAVAGRGLRAKLPPREPQTISYPYIH